MLKRSTTLLLLIILCIALVAFPNVEIVKAEPITIVVPDDYASIQEAIGVANEGDTVFVKRGIYVETLIIDRTISLVGEDRVSTVIDGNNTAVRHVIEVTANNVKIAGFTIQKSGGVKYYERAGIYIAYSEGNNISYNVITDNYGNGIRLEGSSNNLILENNIIENFASGIAVVYSSHNNTIKGNVLTDNFLGIYVADSDNQNIENNQVTTSGNDGIYIDYSFNNIIAGNTVLDSYLFGMNIYRSSNNNVYKNFMSNNVKGIRFSFSENNTVFQNNMTNNEHGLDIDSSSHNLIFENVFSNNEIGVILKGIRPVNNTLWNNDFVDNTKQGLDDASEADVFWDNGAKGNYWSSYNGTDSDGDGIGDTPYIINEYNQDNYPLMEPTIIPEFPSWTPLLITLVALVAVAMIYRRRLHNQNQRGEK